MIPSAALREYAGLEFALIRVCYDRQQQIDAVNSLLDRATALWNELRPCTKTQAEALLGITGYILIELLLRLKHPDFAEEHEWRVLLIMWAAEHTTVLRHRTRNGQQVPYVEWRFRRTYLDEVLIGPGPFGMDEKLPRRILAENGLEHVAVSRSRIPLQ